MRPGSGTAPGRASTPRISITIDCHAPRPLVEFWCEALGYVPEPPPGGHERWVDYWRSIGIPEEELQGAEDAADSIVDPAGIRPRIWFQVVPEAKAVKNRVHLDLDITERRSMPLEVRRSVVRRRVEDLVAAGGWVLRTMAPAGSDYFAIVVADPEGNEFCIS